ncbi:MAG: hypothetical protein ACXABU_06545 [Candidatus Hodarchaeales archaeon]|jgi:hypothetical protein
MPDNPPLGVRIKVEETKERCGKCQAQFIMEVYYHGSLFRSIK